MIRLSRAGWNNVLIFSSLIMIMLLNGLHKNLWKETELHESTLLDAKSFALTFNFTAPSVNQAQYRLERAGREWRFMIDSVEQSQRTPLDAQATVERWQTLLLTLTDEVVALHHLKHQEPTQIVSVWIAGEANPRSYQLLLTPPSMSLAYIKGPSTQEDKEFFWFEVPKDKLSLLGFMQ